jgi:hypothetical protein
MTIGARTALPECPASRARLSLSRRAAFRVGTRTSQPEKSAICSSALAINHPATWTASDRGSFKKIRSLNSGLSLIALSDYQKIEFAATLSMTMQKSLFSKKKKLSNFRIMEKHCLG